MALFGPPNIEKLKQRGDVKALVKALAYREKSLRREAARALVELGAGIGDSLDQLQTERRVAARVLLKRRHISSRWMDRKASVNPSADDLPDEVMMPERVELALGKLRTAWLDSLAPALADDDRDVRLATVWALGHVKGSRTAKRLAALLIDGDLDMRPVVGVALMRQGESYGLRALRLYNELLDVLVEGPEAVARLVALGRREHPGHDILWYLEKVRSDLVRDRTRWDTC